MASLHKDPRGKSPFWYCAFTLPDGRRTFRSTKITDRKKAFEVCLQWQKASEQARGGNLVEAQARAVVNAILEASGQTPIVTETVTNFFNGWLAGKSLSKKPRTAERYRIVIGRFLDSLGSKVRQSLTALSPKDFEAFRDSSMAAGKAPKTVSVEMKILRSVLNVARRQGLVLANPAEAVELPRVRSHSRDVFTPEQVRLLLNVAEPEWRTAILLGFYTGARLTDVTNMTWEHVDLAGGVITYEQGKTAKVVSTPIHPDLEAHLSAMAGDNPTAYLCPTLQRRSIGGRSGLSQTFGRMMREAGLDQKQVRGKGRQGRVFSRLSFHSLRATFASTLANAGIPEEIRMRLAGHADTATHQKYTHLEMRPLRAAISALPNLTGR